MENGESTSQRFFRTVRKASHQERASSTSKDITEIIDLISEEVRKGNSPEALQALTGLKELIVTLTPSLDDDMENLKSRATQYMSMRKQIWELHKENADLRGDTASREQAENELKKMNEFFDAAIEDLDDEIN